MARVHRRADLDVAAEQAAADRRAIGRPVTRRAGLDTGTEQTAAERRATVGRTTRRADLDVAAEQAAAEKRSAGGWFTRGMRRARAQARADAALRRGDTDEVLAVLAENEHARVILASISADRDGLLRRTGSSSTRIAYAGVRAHVDHGHTSGSSGLAVFVPVGPISVGLGGGRSRSTVIVVVDHPDGQWRIQVPGKQATVVQHFVALINTAAARCSSRRLS